MILLITEQIREIAEQLDCGFSCFINKHNREQIFLYGDEDDFFEPENDAWADERKKIDKNPGDYLEIEKMESRDSFSVMEDFADTVDSVKLRKDLIYVLNKKNHSVNLNMLLTIPKNTGTNGLLSKLKECRNG